MSQLAQRLIMAAGGAKKDSTYIEDVFSTYLYKGNGIIKPVNNGIKLANNNLGSSVSMIGDGSGSGYGTGCIYVPPTADFKFGTGAFTIEFFIYFVQSTDYIAVFDGRTNNSNNNNDRTVTGLLANGQFNWWNLGTGAVIANSAATQVAANEWSHVAYVREGTGTNQAKMYINGSLVGTGTDPKDYNVNQPCRIGGHAWSPGILYGSFSNYRVVKGTAVYTSNFTPPTQELTAISGTVLLCCQSSTDPFAATVSPGGTFTNGNNNSVNPIAESFGPFTATDAKGGMVWIKSRDNGYWHSMVDTERGANKTVYPNSSWQEETLTNLLNSFNNNGFIAAYNSSYSAVFANKNNDNYASWTFAKQKGFFDVVTWTGNNTAGRQLPHNLGSRPGMVAIKCLSHNHNWVVWHRNLSSNAKVLTLNDNDVEFTNDAFNGAAPTDSVIYLSSTNASNAATKTYVAYLWAGGASDEPGAARSVDFDGTDNQLNIPDSDDWDLGNGDFTLETWIKSTQTTSGYFTALGPWTTHVQADGRDYSWCIRYASQDIGTGWSFFYSTTGQNYVTTMGADISDGQWHHIAVCRSGNKLRTFTDGVLNTTRTTTDTFYNSGTTMKIGGQSTVGNYFDGQLSNVRLVKGTALYTSSFRPPTAGLTDITNTKLLCCNKNTVTGSTVTPGTITTSSSPSSTTDTPFDDPNGFKFGEGGDQNLIKTGGYTGNGNSNGPEVYLGWEPSWVMVKGLGGGLWLMADNMRGVVTGGDDPYLQANGDNAEYTTYNWIEFTPTGFKLTNTGVSLNTNGDKYVYIAIRRPDGYVGKPVEAGTDVLTMTPGTSGAPLFLSPNHIVDFALQKSSYQSGTADWTAVSRLTQGFRLETNTTDAESANTYQVGDYQNGWSSYTGGDGSRFAWLFKRSAGFDVVTYKADSTSKHSIPHSLGQTPEMMWVKNRDNNNRNWAIYHKGLNGGTNPEQYYMEFDAGAEATSSTHWSDTAPTAFDFTIGSSLYTNEGPQQYIAYLFASVEGISKVDFWIGDGTNNRQITLGFQPRFLLVTLANQGGGYGWQTMDSVRGFIGTGGSGNEVLRLNNGNAESSQNTYFTPNATGFTITESAFNGGSQNWIYYAHA